MSVASKTKAIPCPTCRETKVTVTELVAKHIESGQTSGVRHECTSCKAKRERIRSWIYENESAAKRRDLSQGYRDVEVAQAMKPVFQKARLR